MVPKTRPGSASDGLPQLSCMVPWEHTGFGTWLLGSHEPEMVVVAAAGGGRSLFSDLLGSGLHHIGVLAGEGRREGDPKGPRLPLAWPPGS